MTSGSSAKIADVCKLGDGAHASVARVEEGVPYLTSKNIGHGRLKLEVVDRISEEDYERLFPRNSNSITRLQPGDVLTGIIGTFNNLYVYKDSDYFGISSAIAVLRPDIACVDSNYLYYYLTSPKLQALKEAAASGSVQGYTNLSVLGGLPISLPPLEEQRAIAEVLGALDDKIAANTKLLDTSDRLSHALFSSMCRESTETVPLSNTAQFVNGKAFTKDASGTGRVIIRIAELNSGLGGSTVYNDMDVDDHHLARPGDILFAWSGSLTLHRWFRPEGIVNQHIFKVIPSSGYPKWLIYELLRHKLEEFKSIAADKATTMGHIQRRHLDEAVAIPAAAEIAKHNELMTSLWDRVLLTETENLKLEAIRDTLLPQLMSGKLGVRDAEELVSVVV